MDEELNENDLEERLYAMLHHVDETQAHVKGTGESAAVNIIENAPRSTIRRYWRTSGDYHPPPSHHQKVNMPKEIPTANKTVNADIQKPKEEKQVLPPPTADLTIFQSPPRIVHKTIEILDIEPPKPVVLESSDEDEVVEVALPPKPTITIESSDEDDVCIITKPTPPNNQDKETPKTNVDRDSASPVPSIVSSVSDDFIRGDCIALNISSRHAENHTFDFSLHGTDLMDQTTPVKKKKKKKAKELATSTPMGETNSNADRDACFATPRSKAKHKKQKSKSVEKASSMDAYDSDSNQSVITSANQNSYIVTEKSLPSADVYDSDSNQSEIKGPTKKNITKDPDSSDSSVTTENALQESTPKTTKSVNKSNVSDDSIVDLTENDYITMDKTGITENIMMANVTGFAESMDYGDETNDTLAPNPAKLGSTKIPPMLYDNLDFDNLKGKDKVCKRRRYSLTTLRAEMEKFYNESWGGEEFNHREIQKYMSRDKSLWVIDPKDRMPGLTKRRTTCHYCDRPGHRDDMCRLKPPVCYMCGSTGHYEPRCPAKICVNCGSPNHMYSSMCRNCCSWHRITCAECGQVGHPASHCPDLWRRYHNTIDMNMPLEENRQYKKHNQLYCSGCTRRGHLVHTCRVTLPFSALPINSPYVSVYRPLYLPVVNSDSSDSANLQEERNIQNNSKNQSQDSSFSSHKSNSKDSRNKRQSKSPNAFESQIKKKKHNSLSESSESNTNSETRFNKNGKSRKLSTSSKGGDDTTNQIIDNQSAPDFIPISSNNRDKEGHIIQDNEVSDTSDVVTLARMYVTQDVQEKFKTLAGQEWLKTAMEKYNVSVQNSDMSSFLTIKGKIADQEAFQTELRDWMSKTASNNRDTNNEVETVENNQSLNNSANDSAMLSHIPKRRKTVLKVITRALDSLNYNLGEPNALYKRLMQLQKQHKLLLKQKVISPDKLSNSTDNIKKVLKKLNMILLGQAGLANGQQSLNKLHALQQRVGHLNKRTLSYGLRKEIAQHYQSIFVAIERNDYSELLQKYHCMNDKPNFNIKKKRNNKINLIQNKSDNDGFNSSIPPRSPNPTQNMKENFPATDNNTPTKRIPKDTMATLVSYRQRIEKAHPKNRNQKMLRINLVRKLHAFIKLLFGKEQINSRTARKMRRVQSEAQQFLITNI